MTRTLSHQKPLLMSILACLLVFAVLAGATSAPFLPENELPDLNATVEIKTQGAADALVNSGAQRGIDVSKYQGSINWDGVARDNVSFVFARASIGNEIDETFVYNATGAHSNGIKIGAYHYAKFTDRDSMLNEVNLLISQLKRVDITYPVALDVEHNRGLDRTTLTNLCIEFMDQVKAAGYTPMFYSYTNFINQYMDVSSIKSAGYDLWVANYIEEPNAGQKVWQHTSYGSVSGISTRVDINIAYDNISTNQRIVVDAGVSRSIKETLNSRYNAGLNLDTLNMADMNRSVTMGLQHEIARQFEIDFPITGTMDSRVIEYLSSITYTPGQTSGNITYLLQVKLFYMGLYTGELSGAYDDNMVAALTKFQHSNNLTANGQIDRATLEWLLW